MEPAITWIIPVLDQSLLHSDVWCHLHMEMGFRHFAELSVETNCQTQGTLVVLFTAVMQPAQILIPQD